MDTERELRRQRRETKKEQQTLKEKELKSQKDIEILNKIKERDSKIREIQRQRDELIKMRLENNTAQQSDVNDETDVKHKQLRRETVGERLQHNCKEMEHEMRTELDYDDDVEGAVGFKTDDYHSNNYESDMDSIDEELSWLTKKMEETFQMHSDSGDRIFKEGVRCSTQTFELSEVHESEYENKSEIDETISDDDNAEKNLEAEIKAMKKQQMKLKEELHRKEKAKRLKEQESLRETRRKQKEERIRKLKRTKQELEQDMMETQSTISSLDEELEPEETYDRHKYLRNAERRVPHNPPLMLKPSVPKFSDPAQFTEWKIEIESMIRSKIYQKDILKQCVRNAISGKPRKVLATLKATATLENILSTMESNFGDVKSGQSIMEEFYQARQNKDEDITSWGIRIEEMIQRALEKGEIQENKKEEILRTKYWKYLRNSELKNATRVFYENCLTFEELRKRVRREEQELKVSQDRQEQPKQINTMQIDQQLSILNDLTEKLQSMQKQLDVLTKEKEASKDNRSESVTREYRRNDNRPQTGYRRTFSQGRGYSGNRGPYRGRRPYGQDAYHRDSNSQQHLNGNQL